MSWLISKALQMSWFSKSATLNTILKSELENSHSEAQKKSCKRQVRNLSSLICTMIADISVIHQCIFAWHDIYTLTAQYLERQRPLAWKCRVDKNNSLPDWAMPWLPARSHSPALEREPTTISVCRTVLMHFPGGRISASRSISVAM